MQAGYGHLTLEKRSQIYALRATKTSRLRLPEYCYPSAITHQLKRNTEDRGYRYKQANVKAVERRLNASRTVAPVRSSTKN